MTYVMSDIHGEYGKYAAMLKRINFSDGDRLYVLGDVIDRGPDSARLLADMSHRHNVYPLIGNHELMALPLLRLLTDRITEENVQSQFDSTDISDLSIWLCFNGGNSTLEAFRALDVQERRRLIEYMESFAPYECIDVGDKSFVLVHAGLGNFSTGKKLYHYTLEELTCMRPDLSKRCFEDGAVYIVCGHTPTTDISGKVRIHRENGYICIDCGATFGGALACLCLDTMEEFYI